MRTESPATAQTSKASAAPEHGGWMTKLVTRHLIPVMRPEKRLALRLVRRAAKKDGLDGNGHRRRLLGKNRLEARHDLDGLVAKSSPPGRDERQGQARQRAEIDP